MRHAILSGFLLLPLLGAGPAHADDAFEACVKADAGALKNCGDAWLAREQAALDAKWTAILGLTDGSILQALKAEQGAWQAYRDGSCAFMRDAGFGPDGDLRSFYGCRAAAIAERAAALDRYRSYIDN